MPSLQPLTDEEILDVAVDYCEFSGEGTYHLRRYTGWAIVQVVRECLRLQSLVDAATSAPPAPHEGAHKCSLQEAAQAVIDRWNSPKWEWHKQGPTADLMQTLAAALAAPHEGAKPVAFMKPGGDVYSMHDCGGVIDPDHTPLYAAPQEHEARDAARWQPIETAPKDGTEILVSWPMRRLDDDGMQTDEITRRSSIVTSWAVGSSGWGEPAFLDASGGYYDDDDEFSPDPDLWQPLPAAPDAARAVKGGGAS